LTTLREFFKPLAMQMTESRLTEWLNQNKRALAGAVAILLVVAIGVGIVRTRANKRAIEATAALYEAELKLEKELKLVGATPIVDVDRQLAETVSAFKKVSQGFSGQAAAWEAGFQLAELYSKYEPRSGKAVPAYQAIYEAAPTPREKVFALYSLAYAYEKQGKFDEAIQKLDQAIGLGQPTLKAELALSRARLLARSGKSAEALKAFEQISKDYANTEFSRKADQWKTMRTL